MDYTVPSIGREFGSVFLGDENVALLVVSEGWAKVCFIYIYIDFFFYFLFLLNLLTSSCLMYQLLLSL